MIRAEYQNQAPRRRAFFRIRVAAPARFGPGGGPGCALYALVLTCALSVSAGDAPAQSESAKSANEARDCVSFAACESRIMELRGAGQSAAALKLLESLADAELSDSARLLKAKLFLDRDRLREAAAIYDDLCRSIRSADCWNALGVVRMSLGGYREASTAFLKSIDVEATARTHSNLAVAFAHLRRLNAARDHHDRALALQPRGIQPRLNFGVFLFTGRRFEEAGRVFAGVLKDAPDQFYARLYLGRVYTMQRKYKEALREFDRGVQLNREFFDLYYHRAVVRAKLGDPGGALSDLNRADRINPVNGLTDALRTSIKSRRR